MFGEPEDGWLLVPNLPKRFPDVPRRYRPLHETGLFRTLAEVRPTKDAVLAFAQEYGTLGMEEQVAEVGPFTGLSLRTWQHHIRVLKELIDLWDAVAKGRDEELQRFESLIYPLQYLSPDPKDHDEHWWKASRAWERNDRRGLALMFLEDTVTTWLHRSGVSASLISDPARQELDLYFTPINLWGVVWLQLAQAIAAKKQYYRCQNAKCRKPFEVSKGPLGKNKNRRFCSDPCRFQAYRDRKEQAQRLAADGVQPEEIARQLESTIKTVQGWLRAAPARNARR